MTMNSISQRRRAPLFASLSLVCAGALLSGCIASPTYGTGKTANAQLVEDLTGVLSLGTGGVDRGPEIAYTPRPELVKPASLEVLPTPQESVASASNPAWPESPEERRARIRAEATENQENPFYRPAVRGPQQQQQQALSAAPPPSPYDTMNVRDTRAELNRRIRENYQGSPTSRKYLSEPPVEYRVPAATAPVGDTGEDEWRKERRAKKAAGESRGLRDLLPW